MHKRVSKFNNECLYKRAYCNIKRIKVAGTLTLRATSQHNTQRSNAASTATILDCELLVRCTIKRGTCDVITRPQYLMRVIASGVANAACFGIGPWFDVSDGTETRLGMNFFQDVKRNELD